MSARKPKQGCETFHVLALLQSLGGSAMPERLIPACAKEYQSKGRVLSALERLEAVYMIRFDAQNMAHMTEIGRAHLFDPGELSTTAAPRGELVRAPSAPEFRPLNVAKLMAGGPQRPGMDDHKQFPSLMSGKRVLPNGEVVE